MGIRVWLVMLASAVCVGSGAQPAAAAGRTVLIIGSSTTACAGQLSSAARCYVRLVEAAHRHGEVTVLGRGGTYIGYGTDPARNWTTTPIPRGYARVIIQLGINDWFVPVQPAELRHDIDRLVGRVEAANPGARIAWVRTWMPLPTGDVGVRQRMWARHGLVTAAAMRAAGGTFLDMGTRPGPRRSTIPGDDGWHYNDRGHAEIAAALNAWLNR
jgi:lysophospholipase L1-like esterase